MTIAKHTASVLALATCAVLALGSGSSKDKDKGSGDASSATTTAAGSADTPLGSCMRSSKLKCVEYSAWVNDERAAKGECTSLGGTFTNGACPSNANLIGTCAVQETTARYKEYVYREPGVKVESAFKEGCEGSGSKWTDGPAAAAGPASKTSAAPPSKPAKPTKPAEKPKK